MQLQWDPSRQADANCHLNYQLPFELDRHQTYAAFSEGRPGDASAAGAKKCDKFGVLRWGVRPE